MCPTMENVILSHWDEITLTVGELLRRTMMFERDSLVMKLTTWEINQVQI